MGIEKMLHGFFKQAGQMTIEFVVVFPVLIIVALISVNVLLFFGECASFDRVFRETVCLYGVSPGYNITTDQTEAKITQSLEDNFSHDFESIQVDSYQKDDGITVFEGQLNLSPTLFGLGAIDSVFGVELPKMSHHSQMAIDVYKPGILF